MTAKRQSPARRERLAIMKKIKKDLKDNQRNIHNRQARAQALAAELAKRGAEIAPTPAGDSALLVTAREGFQLAGHDDILVDDSHDKA